MGTTEPIKIKPSVCPLDCPDTCSLSVETDGERVLKVKGSKGNLILKGTDKRTIFQLSY